MDDNLFIYEVQTEDTFISIATKMGILQELLQGRKLTEKPDEILNGLIEFKYVIHKITKQLGKAEVVLFFCTMKKFIESIN